MNITILIIAGLIGVLFISIALIINLVQAKKKKSALKTIIQDRGETIYESHSKETKTDKKKDNKGRYSKKLKTTDDDMPVDGLPLKSIRYMLIQAGLDTPVYRFWIYSAICSALCYFAATFFGMSQIVTLLWAIIGFFGLPRFILKKKVARRQRKFLEEFADCLEGMIRLLKSGMPISEAIAMSSREYSGPIGEEMTKVYEDQRVGDTLPEAVEKMAFRVPIPEVKMFSTAITIQVQTGSSLSEVLQNLSTVIRQRFRLKRKIQALSAEAKISAAIIGCLPLIVVGSMYLLSRDYIELLWITNTGKLLMYGSLAWMSIGVFIMKEMINFKV